MRIRSCRNKCRKKMVNEIIEQLAAVPGRNDKIGILTENSEDTLLEKVLEYALDPYLQFYIRKIPPYTPMGTGTIEQALFDLGQLSNREVTGHAAAQHLSNILSSLEEDDAKVIEKIIKKDLRCGVQASTVNKVFKDLIPTYPCLLASPYSQKLVDQVLWPAMAQHKLDGMRANVFVVDGKVGIRGRSGRVVDLLGKLDKAMIAYDFVRQLNFPMPLGCVYDGELVMLEKDGTIMSRKKGNGIINKAIKGTISEDEASRVRIILWDIIPADKFKEEKYEVEYVERFHMLQRTSSIADVEDPLRQGQEMIQLAETRIVNNEDESTVYFNEMLQRGQEGIILKTYQAIWENKRSKGLIKYKAEEEIELQVDDWVEGVGKYRGVLGALVCSNLDNSIVVSVGTGFSDEERKEITKEVIGSIITVKYNERISSDKGKADSLFLPRYVEIRLDKDVAD